VVVLSGLLESQTFDGIDEMDRGLPIEEKFCWYLLVVYQNLNST
jgi:hypothetical protein